MHDVFYFTDVHGNYALYRAVIDFCMKQDDECTIIFGGDACDRGPDGYRIMKELLDNPRVIYLKGNHEDMFVHAAWFIERDYIGPLEKEHIREYLHSCFVRDFYSKEVQLSIYNGGMDTLTAWMLGGMPQEFVTRIAKLPLTFTYENMDFCHAGGNYKTFMRVNEDEYYDRIVDKDDATLLLWDRNYIAQGWQPNRTCIYGHTPTPNLAAKYYGKDKSKGNAHPCSYIGQLDDKWTGRKINMDVGTYNNGRLYVINCLTCEVHGFIDTDFYNEEIHNHDVVQFEIIQF